MDDDAVWTRPTSQVMALQMIRSGEALMADIAMVSGRCLFSRRCLLRWRRADGIWCLHVAPLAAMVVLYRDTTGPHAERRLLRQDRHGQSQLMSRGMSEVVKRLFVAGSWGFGSRFMDSSPDTSQKGCQAPESAFEFSAVCAWRSGHGFCPRI